MEIKDAMLRYEKTYSEFATKDSDAIYLKDFESDIIQSDNNAVEIAQEMIKFPLSKAYIELKQGEI